MMTSEAHFIIFLVLSLLLFLDISGAQATEGGNDLSPRRSLFKSSKGQGLSNVLSHQAGRGVRMMKGGGVIKYP